MKSTTVVAFLLVAVFYLVQCSEAYDYNQHASQRSNIRPDLAAAATGHHGHGRVQIKVYRGPSDGHEHFAPHGYWVKQPADHHH